MEGIDFVYSVSAPFFLGDMLKALQESEKVELPESELEQFRELNIFKIRSYVELGHLDKLQKFLKGLLNTTGTRQQELLDITSQLILFLAQKKINPGFVQSGVQLSKSKGLKKMTRNGKYRVLTAALILLHEEDYEQFFEILHPPSDQHELLALKLLGYHRIHRYDLGQGVLEEIAGLDSLNDHPLSKLCLLFNKISGGELDGCMGLLNEFTQQYDFSFRLYNYIVYACLCVQQPRNFKAACKLVEQFFSQQGIVLSDPNTYKQFLGLPDFKALLFNYMTVLTHGKAQAVELQVESVRDRLREEVPEWVGQQKECERLVDLALQDFA